MYLCIRNNEPMRIDMKKIALLFWGLAGILTVQASPTPASIPDDERGEFTYLTFETTDGAKVSVPVASLTLNVSGTSLTAGSQTFTLSNLSKMFFSYTEETTAISDEFIANSEEFATATFYDLQGHQVPKAQMKKGVYIVKTKKRTYKLIVR